MVLQVKTSFYITHYTLLEPCVGNTVIFRRLSDPLIQRKEPEQTGTAILSDEHVEASRAAILAVSSGKTLNFPNQNLYLICYCSLAFVISLGFP